MDPTTRRCLDRMLAEGQRTGSTGGSPLREIATAEGTDLEDVRSILNEWRQRGWLSGEGELLDASLTTKAPQRLPSLGSAASQGEWSKDRWGHTIFREKPRPSEDPED